MKIILEKFEELKTQNITEERRKVLAKISNDDKLNIFIAGICLGLDCAYDSVLNHKIELELSDLLKEEK